MGSRLGGYDAQQQQEEEEEEEEGTPGRTHCTEPYLTGTRDAVDQIIAFGSISTLHHTSHPHEIRPVYSGSTLTAQTFNSAVWVTGS